MELLVLPNDYPAREREHRLDGSIYLLRLTWWPRRSGWYLDLSTLDGVDIISGRRISPGDVPFPRGVVGAPRGSFFVTGWEDPAPMSALGNAFELYYIDEAELAEIRAGVDLFADVAVRLL